MKLLSATLLTTLGLLTAAYAGPTTMPSECPSGEAIKAVPFFMLKAYSDKNKNDHYFALQETQSYNTNWNTWDVVIDNITATSLQDAHQKLNAILPTLSLNLSLNDKPICDEWGCICSYTISSSGSDTIFAEAYADFDNNVMSTSSFRSFRQRHLNIK